MRVLVWSPFFHPDVGGIESLLVKLLPRIRTRNIDVAVVASHGRSEVPDESDHEGIRVYRFPFREAVADGDPRKIIQLLSQVSLLKQSFHPDIVHVHLSDPSVFFHLKTSRAHAAETIVTLHGDFGFFGIEPGSRSLLTKTLAAASWVTAVSHETLLGAAPFLSGIKTPTSVIYNGVSVVDDSQIRAPDLENPIILCIGRLVEQKGFDDAISVFARITEQFPASALWIAGDGPLEGALRHQVHENGLADRTNFLGRIEPDDVAGVLSRATIVLMPSRVEAFPMVLLEAGMMARPTVCTNVGGVREAIIDGENGLLVAAGDRAGLVEAVVSLLSSPRRCQQMGAAARRHVLSHFTLEASVGKYASLYETVLGARSHRENAST